MEDKGKYIDDLFREELGDYAEAPPPAAWDRLEQKLGSAKKIKSGRSYRRAGYLGLAFLLLLLGISVIRSITDKAPQSLKDIALNNNKTTTASKTAQGSDVAQTVNKPIANTTELTQANDKTSETFPNESNNVPDKNEVAPINKNLSSPIIAAKNGSSTGKTKRMQKKKAIDKYAPAKTSRATNKSGKSGSGNEEDAKDNETVYNSAAPKNTTIAPGPHEYQEESITDKNKTKEIAIIPSKAIVQKPRINLINDNPAKQKVKVKFNRFEAGIKAGYETGFNNDAAKKAVVSPYIQYNITPKWSVMLQPSIKSASLSTRRIGTAQSYYKVNDDGKVTLVDSLPIYIPEGAGIVDSLWRRNYSYSQSHDSIVKANSIGGTYMEFEIPVLLKYYINKKLSVYGGMNIIYSKLISINENTTTSQPITISKSEQTIGGYYAPAPTKPSLDAVITYSGNSISGYTGPQYPAASSIQMRFGYMLGFSYEYNKRWLLDALVQQGSVSPNVQAGYNVNAALSAAYLRLTLGYKLIK